MAGLILPMIIDALGLSDLIWSDRENRYYYQSGRAVPQRAINQLIQRTQASYLTDVVETTNRLVKKEISLADWEKVVAESVRDSHVQMMRIGRGGKDKTYAIHYLDVANELRQNQYPYLRKMVEELRDGKISRAQLNNRLASYIRSSRISYQKGVATRQNQYAVRKINDKAENCPDCIRYFAMGIMPVGEIPLPMTACQCRTNCKCSIHYGTYEDLLKLRNGWLS